MYNFSLFNSPQQYFTLLETLRVGGTAPFASPLCPPLDIMHILNPVFRTPNKDKP
jgi:hypothetical protein